MAVGQGALHSGQSYIGIGRETTLGTGVTASAGLPFISSSLMTMKERQRLDQIESMGNRTQSKSIGLGRVTEGDIEMFFLPDLTASAYLLENAFGADLSSATATGDASAFEHTFTVGDIQNATYEALTISKRRGNSTDGKVFEYVGCRINELNFSSEIDNALVVTASIVGIDGTVGSTDVSGNFGNVGGNECLNFDRGRLSVETSFAALTTTSFWHVQSIEFSMNNNIKSDSEARRIGSDTPDVLPPGNLDFTFNATIRFDTTTAYDAMIAETQFAAQLEFLGTTITGGTTRKGLRLNMPKIYIMEAGTPEIGGPDEVLQSEVTFQVLRDDSSTNGYAIQGVLTNGISAY